MRNHAKAAAINGVKQSIVHRNATPASTALAQTSRKDRPRLIALFERFGNLVYSHSEERMLFCDREKVSGKRVRWDASVAQQIGNLYEVPAISPDRTPAPPTRPRKGKTLYDRATARRTMRATKYAKDLGSESGI